MPYCTIADVQAHRPQHLITTTSKPTQSQVEAEITALGTYVNGRLASAGFSVPVTTGAVSLAYLRTLLSYGVAGIIEDQQKAGLDDGKETQPRRSYFTQLFTQMLQAVIDAPTTLIDATRSTDAAVRRSIESFFTNNPTDDVTAGQRGRLTGTAVPRFEIRKEF